jgi:L-threonylcarbamoyladenylate synthase
MILDPKAAHAIEQIVAHLKQGQLVAIPTETVYGLAADAANQAAVEKIFRLKQRPFDNPLIVLIADSQQMLRWASHIPDVAWQLAEHFWPGPLTLILPKAEHVNTLLTAGQDSIALRVPAHPLALTLLQAFKGGLAAPSANPFMALSPTTAKHVASFFDDDLWIVDGGASSVGLESTIIDCCSAPPVILREGMITSVQIKNKTGLDIQLAKQTKVKHAGQYKLHYAPKTRLRLFLSKALDAELGKSSTKENIALLAYQSKKNVERFKKVMTLSDQPREYAKNFYAALHALDSEQCAEIWVEIPPEEEGWQAVHERLLKASAV